MTADAGAGLRRFLLDYAEKAPKAERVSIDPPTWIRFGTIDTCRCPLELAAGMQGWAKAANFYGLSTDSALIVRAADGRNDGSTDGPWRAILEKLAEPDEARR